MRDLDGSITNVASKKTETENGLSMAVKRVIPLGKRPAVRLVDPVFARLVYR